MALVNVNNITGNVAKIYARTADGVRGTIRIYSDQDYGQGSGGSDSSVPFFVLRRDFTGEGYFTETLSKPGRYVVLLGQEGVSGEVDYQYFTIVGDVTPPPIVSGKEYVFEFSGLIQQSSMMVSAANKIVSLLGGKSVYIEGNKLVVVM